MLSHRILMACLALVTVWILPARAFDIPLAQALSERTLGKAEAPVTIIEYASFTCPHCARFDRETLPRLKSAYIEAGKVKLIYRDFPLDGAALLAAALARCAPAERYFPLATVLFQQQDAWMRAKDTKEVAGNLEKIGRLAGIPKETIEACLSSTALLDGIADMRLKGEREFKVDGTPAFIIGKTKINGAPSFDELERVLKHQLSGD